jgi:AraC family transcriptional regulator
MHALEFPRQESINRLKNVVKNQLSELEWPNVLATTSHKQYEKTIPESAFTIITNQKGAAHLYLKKRTLKVCEQTFYLSNPFESFYYKIDSNEQQVDTFNIHLNYAFYTKVLYSCLNSDEMLLDKPFEQTNSYQFVNQLHFRAIDFNQALQSYSKENEDIFFANILLNCLFLDSQEKTKSLNIPVTKRSTQKELSRRMILVKDYIYSNYQDADLSIDQLSKLVLMSHFHFLRVFKNTYKKSPYQYIKQVRIERANFLLLHTNITIKEIAFRVGFKESTAIYPIMKKYLLNTPQKYRKRN